MAIKEESTAGTPVLPSAGTDYIPLRPSTNIEPNIEAIESDELLNDIGQAKGALGKESPSGSHGAYLKHSETEGQAPETALLFKSALGAQTDAVSEYTCAAASDAGSATQRAFLEMGSDEEDNFEVGQAVLIKDLAQGYSIRNVQNVDSVGNQLDLNFNIANAPASGVSLGQSNLIKPASSGHPSYTLAMRDANGGAYQVVAGCRTSAVTMNLPATQQAEVEFSFEGTSYYFNPIEITASNNYIDFTDDVGTVAATLSQQLYKSPIDLAAEVAAKMTAASVGSGDDVISCSYDSQTGQFTVSTDGATLSLLWNSGTNTANTAGGALGFTVASDDTGATSYVGDNAIDLSESVLTAAFDDSDNIVVKNAELMIGDYDDNICREASNVSFTIDSPTEEVLDLCKESGIADKVVSSRSVSMEATLTLKKHESSLFDKFINNASTSIMANIGPKDAAGNWVPGKCVNICMLNATITGHKVSGDTFVLVEITAKGFVDSTRKDMYINFI